MDLCRPSFSSCWRAVLIVAALCSSGACGQVFNPGFELGTTAGWFATGGATLSVTSDARSGQFAAEIAGRTQTWNAPNQTITPWLESGTTYQYVCWVKPLEVSSAQIVFTLRIVDANGERFVRITQANVPGDEWTRVSGLQSVEVTEPVSSVQFYIEGPPAGVSYRLDDASIVAVDGYDWRAAADVGIETHRKADLLVRVVDQDGLPRDGVDVSVLQESREFRFGTAVAAPELSNPQYAAFIRDHFNMATPENAWKWRQTEFFRDSEFYANADDFLAFCLANDIRIHGHAVLWAVDERVPDWAFDLGASDLQAEIDERVESVVGRYAGLVDAWDVNNEMLHGFFFQSRLGAGFRPQLFRDVEAVDPLPGLFVNDFNVLTGTRLEDYVEQIEGLLDAGAPVGGIGVQGHYNTAVDPFVLRVQLDRLAELGLPIRVTEYDYVRSGASYSERADSLEAMYRVAFSHPAVEAMSIWGFWADRHWRGAGAALVESDWTINPVGQRLLDLFDEWWTDTQSTADAAGEFSTRVFHGVHAVTATDSSTGASVAATVAVAPGVGSATVELVLERPVCGVADVAAPRGVLDASDLVTLLGTIEDDAEAGSSFFTVLEALRLFDEGCPE